MAIHKTRGEEIQAFILKNVTEHPENIAKLTATHFDITRQAVNKHLKKMVADATLTQTGKTRNRIYTLGLQQEWTQSYPLNKNLAEDIVWRNDLSGKIVNLPDNVQDIWHYSFTEMFNNAKDHSEGSEILVHFKQTIMSTEIFIHDDGYGIFKKIQDKLNLLDERHAVLELSKGKLTTDPEHHSGEGIFFSSRMFDQYAISSGGVYFSHQYSHPEDWIFERQQFDKGTTVWMKLNNEIKRNVKAIFDEYTSDDDYGFNKTVVPVKLAQYSNDKLISRSQAKRLLARIELFKIVIFDFMDVEMIGQAFADEIFRVFAKQHPEIEILFIHANKTVSQMINRAIGKV